MEITSFYFLCFYALILPVYYIVPRKAQWVILLASSFAFYVFAGGNKWLILWPVSAIAVTYICTRCMGETSSALPGIRRTSMIFCVTILIGSLAVLKYMKFGGGVAIPLGISYYTFILTGYAFDVYNGIAPLEKNPAKLALYGLFFPTVVSGPIVIYRNDGAQYFAGHSFDYNKVTKGLQRMVWGFFKKLVISERAAVMANTIFDNYTQYRGAWIWIGAVMFTIQLYTDFSGCMDIVMGVAETFGFKLPENFRQPFFSKSISEYWRRWHITLGVWMKDYVFYPLLRSGLFMNMSRNMKKKLGKKAGKQITTFTAMFILWGAIGLWHGGDIKYVIGSGLLHWFYIVMGEVTLPFWKRVLPAMHIKMEGRGADLFRIIRTFFLVNIGNTFFRAASAGDAVHMLGRAFTTFNPQVMFSGAFLSLGLDWTEFTIFVVSVVIMFVVSVLEVTPVKSRIAAAAAGEAVTACGGKSVSADGSSGGTIMTVRDRIARHRIVTRWLIWFALLFFVIIFGEYGPGYDSSAFIYAGF